MPPSMKPDDFSKWKLPRAQGHSAVLSVRPKVAELSFQLFGRALHPELFEVHKSRTIERADYTAKLEITTAGHVITWRHRGLTLTEVAASAQHPLPERRRLLSYRLKGQRVDRVECRGGIVYHTNFQLEPVSPELFWTFQEELSQGGERQGLVHQTARVSDKVVNNSQTAPASAGGCWVSNNCHVVNNSECRSHTLADETGSGLAAHVGILLLDECNPGLKT